MPNIFDMALGILKNNPQVSNTPMGKNFMTILQNKDAAKGQELANNILESQGMTKDSALQDIRSQMPNNPLF